MPLSLRERQQQALREALYETALELFTSQGYEATTVQQITERLGVAKGTLFNYFPSKEHLVAQWYNGITERSLAAARERPATSAREAIGELFADMSGQATAAPELLIAKFRHSTSELLMDAEKAQVDRIDCFLRERCTEAVERGELPPDLDVGPFCDLLTAVLTGTSRAWVYTRPRFDFPAVIRQRVDFLFHALRPQN